MKRLHAIVCSVTFAASSLYGQVILRPESFRHYIDEFRQQEKLVTGSLGNDSYDWMAAEIAGDYARYWLKPEADPWKYSVPLADAFYQVTLATGSRELGRDNLSALMQYAEHWDATQRDSNGLYWSIDTRDAMEKSISG